jgi:signal transduction histidine kinase
MPYTDDPQGVRLRLRGYLGAQLGPLAVLLFVVVCVSAPAAFFVLGRRGLRAQAAATAAQVAQVIERDARQRPRLWRYDTMKLLSHMQVYEHHEGIDRIDVVDVDGLRIETGALPADLASRSLLWASAPIRVNEQSVGAVWVATSTHELRRNTLLLLLAFGALGAVLGGLMYWLPTRAMGRVQLGIEALVRRLEESQSALAALNENLEHQVEDRSSALRDAYRELQDKEKHLRELSARAVALQEAERRGIARELHDSAGQAMTAIRIHLQLITDLLVAAGAETEKVTDLARRTTAMVDQTVEEIRRAVNQLGPAVLDDVGLEAALERVADDLADTMDIEVSRELEIPAQLDASVETTCYRVVQEALTNVARHASASVVEIEVRPRGRGLEVRVRDDGRGFDPGERRSGSRGLVGMRERIELLGGELDIGAAPGRGVEIRAWIPVSRPSPSAAVRDDPDFAPARSRLR